MLRTCGSNTELPQGMDQWMSAISVSQVNHMTSRTAVNMLLAVASDGSNRNRTRSEKFEQ